MTKELRRSNRFEDFLPIAVSACKIDDDSVIAGPFSARIVDLSNHGACLLLTKVMIQSFHIFHSTREDENTNIMLSVNLSSQGDPITIPAMPIWLNATKIDDLKVFKMGVDFIDSINDDMLNKINKFVTQS